MHSLRLSIDASHTACSGKSTGIERVVRNLCQHLPILAREAGIDDADVATHIGSHFYSVDAPQRDALDTISRWEANAQQFVPSWIQAGPRWLSRSLRWRKASRWLEPAPSHLGMYKTAHRLTKWGMKRARVLRGGPICPGNEHALILPDAYWAKRDIWPSVARYRQSGSMIVSVVYDLIPLSHPEFVGQKRSDKFRIYLDDLIQHSDVIVAISETVRDDVQRYIRETRPTLPSPELYAFTLGAEMRECSGPVRPEIESLFSASTSHPPYLMVASIDPRKNHVQALDAFEILWHSLPQAKLCFVGRIGKQCADLVRRIQSHPRFGSQLFLISDMTDAELQVAYQGCAAVLLPSVVEGFGLPIVESLWHGKKTLASDTPIHREVGGDACEYFPLHDPQALAQAIQRWEAKRHEPSSVPAQPRRFIPASWNQSARQFLDIVQDAYERRQRPLRTSGLAA